MIKINKSLIEIRLGQHPTREQRQVAGAGDGARFVGEDEEGDGGVAGGAEGGEAEGWECGLGPFDEDAAGSAPVIGVEPEEAVHDALEHRAAGHDGGGVEGFGGGEGDDGVGGGATECGLEGDGLVVVAGEIAGFGRVRLEDAGDGLGRDEEAEGLAREGGSEVARLVSAGRWSGETEAGKEKKEGGGLQTQPWISSSASCCRNATWSSSSFRQRM